jgi:hypothetical protein
MNVVMANCWKRRRKRYCGHIDKINQNNIRKSLSFQVPIWYKGVYREKAFAVLKPFLEENILNERMRICMRKFAQKIEYIQKRFKD